MARVTVEDCIDKVESPYELVLVAKERATQLNAGVEPSIDRDNDKNTVISLREIAEEKIKVSDLTDSAVYKLRKHVEQVDDGAEDDEEIGDDFENLYKGEISKSGTPILPSKRARKTPEKIQVSREDLAELSESAKPNVDSSIQDENANEQGEVSLEEVSVSENQEADVSEEDTEASNSQKILYNYIMNRKVSVAPMMDCTDRHERFFLRLISKNILLYTEMIVDEAINRGDKKKLLEFNINEKPVALQLGGSSPKLLAEATKVGEDYGYDEINLNLGCPSRKVEKNRFGACLMKEPDLVADCLSKMKSVTKLPVTIKTRIGYDNVEDYDNLKQFISKLKSTGVETFIIHARKAMLGKFTPKQNLNIPPLKYNYVYKLKEDFPNEEIIINGGITKADEIKPHLEKTDGVMIGRAAYHSPYLLADIEKKIFNNNNIPSRQDVIEKFIPYVKDELKKGIRLNQIMRHTLGLFHGQTGASYWKKYLSENMCVRDADVKKIDHIMDKIKFNNVDIRAGQSA